MILAYLYFCLFSISELNNLIIEAKKQECKKQFTYFADCNSSLNLLKSSDSLAKNMQDNGASAVINQHLAYCFYNKNIYDSFVFYQLIARDLFLRIGNKARSTNILNNLSFVHEENLSDIPSAIKFADTSTKEYMANYDTPSAANMYKYIGLLKSKIGKAKEGRNDIIYAQKLFEILKDDQGYAVSLFDMGINYYNDNKIDSALSYVKKSIILWKSSSKNTVRLFSFNNRYIDLLLKNKNIDSAYTTFVINDHLLRDTINYKIPINTINYFYKLSYELFNIRRDTVRSKYYEILSKGYDRTR